MAGHIALKRLDQIPPTRYEDTFLIGDLLTTHTTFLTGEPKSGKTLLAVGMVIALLNGEAEFLDLPVMRKLNRVVFGLTDDGAEEELRARFDDAVPDPEAVLVFNIEDTGMTDYWVKVRDTLREVNADLFVLDNVLGSLADGDDISSSAVGQKVATNLRIAGGSGVPVLAITHTPKGMTEGLSVSSSVIGSRAIAAGGRGVASLRNPKSGGRRLQTAINRAHEDLDIPVSVRRRSPDSEVPIWTRGAEKAAGEKSKRQRSEKSADGLKRLAEHLIAHQPEGAVSVRTVAGTLAGDFGVSENAVVRKLKSFCVYEGGAWKAAAT